MIKYICRDCGKEITEEEVKFQPNCFIQVPYCKHCYDYWFRK